MLAATVIALAVLLPAGLAAAALVPGGRRPVAVLAIAAPLPALACAGLPPGSEATTAVVHLGLSLGIDAIAPPFLAAIGLVWMAAAWQARLDRALTEGPGGRLFLASLMAALCGAVGAALATEATGFYLFFSLMTLAAYGLIVAAGPHARWAGRLFIGLALAGEMAMLAGFMAAAAPVVPGVAVALLLYFGMGTKHAVLPLHPWLPPAHGTAPPAASALLSGPILSTGVLGWLRFLPLAEEEGMAALLPLMAGGGLAAAFLAAFAGVVQVKPKVVLAYSSVSQMGILTAAAAFAVAHPPASWPAVAPVLGLFAFHHATTKGALFLSVQARGRWMFPAQALLGLSIAGGPLTSGALVKLWLHEAGPGHAGNPVLGTVSALLPWAAVGSGLLVARLLWLVRPGTPPPLRHMTAAGPALVLAVLALGGGWAAAALLGAPLHKAAEGAELWAAAWPVLFALGLSAVVVATRLRLRPVVPNGDIAVWLARLLSGMARRRRRGGPWLGWIQGAAGRLAAAPGAAGRRILRGAEAAGPVLESVVGAGLGGVMVAIALAFALDP